MEIYRRCLTKYAHEHPSVLNTRHPDSGRIRLAGREDFVFSSRSKATELH